MDALDQPFLDLRNDILGKHAATAAYHRRQPHRIVALAGANVGNHHAGPDARQLDDLLGLPEPIANVLRREGVAHDRGDGPVGLGKARLFGRLTAGAQCGQ